MPYPDASRLRWGGAVRGPIVVPQLSTVRRLAILAGWAVSPLLVGCAATSRVDPALTTASLSLEGKAVVVIRIGAASPTCRHVAVLLGTPEGAGYRRHSVLQIMNVTSLVEPAVAEAELKPGTYHIVGYSCHDGVKQHAVGQKADPGTYASTFAHFTVAAGEIVNAGYLHLHATKIMSNAFGRPLRTTVTVTDWPLAELDRFKNKRPRIYSQMVKRLMTVSTPGPGQPTSEECARFIALRTEGKVQEVPAACAIPTPAPGKTPTRS